MPAYIGQLTVVAVVGRANAIPSRWLAVRHAVAYVLGFGAVFTILGITATFVGGPLADYLPAFRTIGGILLIVMGLNLAGDPADPRPRPDLAAAGGGRRRRDGPADRHRCLRHAGRRARGRGSASAWEGGWSAAAAASSRRSAWASSSPSAGRPCIGIILGGILTVAASSGTTLQGGLLLVAYTLGLGIPFILLGVVYDRAPAVVRPLVRHGRAVSFVGGILVAVIGVFMLMDGLACSWG